MPPEPKDEFDRRDSYSSSSIIQGKFSTSHYHTEAVNGVWQCCGAPVGGSRGMREHYSGGRPNIAANNRTYETGEETRARGAENATTQLAAGEGGLLRILREEIPVPGDQTGSLKENSPLSRGGFGKKSNPSNKFYRQKEVELIFANKAKENGRKGKERKTKAGLERIFKQ